MGTQVGRDLCKPEVKQIVFQTINIVSFICFNSSVLCSKVVFISFSILNSVSQRFCSPEDSSLVLLQGYLAFSFPFCFPLWGWGHLWGHPGGIWCGIGTHVWGEVSRLPSCHWNQDWWLG